MNARSLLAVAAALGVLAGCGSQKQKVAEDRTLDIYLVRAVQDTAMKNAIIAQRTLFPYHFVPGSADLNDLGKVDLSILAGHLRDHPGRLNVRRGGAEKDLHDARVRRVQDLLEGAGVKAGGVEIVDGLPGGDGISSDRANRIQERDEESSSRGARNYRAAAAGGASQAASKTGPTKNGGTR